MREEKEGRQMTHHEAILEALETLGNATTTEIMEASGTPHWAVICHLHKMARYHMVADLGTVGFREEHRWRLTV